jgi:hypothetical protein
MDYDDYPNIDDALAEEEMMLGHQPGWEDVNGTQPLCSYALDIFTRSLTTAWSCCN